jgi:prevent-host-death family protein
MEHVGAFEAKTNLSSLLGRVEMGETIIITRHGKPIARLIPEAGGRLTKSLEDVIRELRSFRESHPMTRAEVGAMIQDGRKY